MTVDVNDLANAIHQQLSLVLLRDAQGNPVTPAPDTDTAYQRMGQALATAVVQHLVQTATVTVTGHSGSITGVDTLELASAIHQQLSLGFLKDANGNPVPPPPDQDTTFQRTGEAIATALVDHLVKKAVALVSIPNVGDLSGTVS